MRRTSILALLGLPLLGVLAACGGRYPQPAAAGGTARGEAEPGQVRGVEAAGLPYAIIDARTGRAVSTEDFWARLGATRAVCVGEEHPNPHHHWAQLTVIDQLSARARGKRLALGMEMVQTPFQGVLDDYRAKAIDEAALISRTGWVDRWGYEFALYRPMIDLARARGLDLIALNAPRELVKRVARVGVDRLTPDERARLPELVLDDAQHRRWFEGVMDGMGDSPHHPPAPATADAPAAAAPPADAPAAPDAAEAGPPFEQIYAAQVVWDEAMAQSASRWLAGGGDLIVILAGTGHCHDSAIVRRLARRGVGPVVSVRPIIDDGEGNVAAALAEAQNDYLFVMSWSRPGA